MNEYLTNLSHKMHAPTTVVIVANADPVAGRTWSSTIHSRISEHTGGVDLMLNELLVLRTDSWTKEPVALQ